MSTKSRRTSIAIAAAGLVALAIAIAGCGGGGGGGGGGEGAAAFDFYVQMKAKELGIDLASLPTLAGRGGFVLANQPLEGPRWQRQPEPPGVPKDRYFLYRAL